MCWLSSTSTGTYHQTPKVVMITSVAGQGRFPASNANIQSTADPFTIGPAPSCLNQANLNGTDELDIADMCAL